MSQINQNQIIPLIAWCGFYTILLSVGIRRAIESREINQTTLDSIAIAFLTFGLLCIYKGRGPVDDDDDDLIEDFERNIEWSSTFWLGEMLVLWSVILCYWDKTPRTSSFILFTITPFLTLWTQGGFWAYVSLMILMFIHTLDLTTDLITYIMESAGKMLTDGPLSSIAYPVANATFMIGSITCVASRYTPMVRSLNDLALEHVHLTLSLL